MHVKVRGGKSRICKRKKERTLGNYMPNVVKGESVHWEEFRYTVKYQASIVIVDQLL